jgi:NADH dehydrogenase
MRAPTALVTGAFSNTGAAVASELLTRGWTVSTLTNRAPAAGDDSRISRFPLTFSRDNLSAAFSGVDAFVNTYWVRFPYRGVTFDDAVNSTGTLIAAARNAGTTRFVQISVSNASLDSPLAYYHGKAQVERDLRSSGLSYGIVRPTLIVGPNDVLSNNICWFLRRCPVIAMPSGSGYRLQPITLADAGRVIADAVESGGNVEVDAAGPETFSFREYVSLLAAALGHTPRFITVAPSVMVLALTLAGTLLRDVVLTREELDGLKSNMLVSRSPPLGRELVSAWISGHGSAFGTLYINDTLRRFMVCLGSARPPQYSCPDQKARKRRFIEAFAGSGRPLVRRPRSMHQLEVPRTGHGTQSIASTRVPSSFRSESVRGVYERYSKAGTRRNSRTVRARNSGETPPGAQPGALLRLDGANQIKHHIVSWQGHAPSGGIATTVLWNRDGFGRLGEQSHAHAREVELR